MTDTLFAPGWLALEDSLDGQLNGRWEKPWLAHTGSLTKAIEQACTHSLNVRVLNHHFIDVPHSACAALKLEPGDTVLHREVLLCDGDTPLVFACSLIPEKALGGRFRALRELGDQPLGHWIFSDPVLLRERMAWHCFSVDDPLFARLPFSLPEQTSQNTQTSIYGRKTFFAGADRPLLVSEFFLPALRGYRQGSGQKN